jgi:hypothetical protein
MAEGLLDNVRRAYEKRERLRDVWDYCETGGDDSQDGLALRARRFNAAAHFAGNRKAQAKTPEERAKWEEAQAVYRKERDRLEKKVERRRHSGLPESIDWIELMHHAPGPHIHASCARPLLIQVCRVAEDKGFRAGEFPPFDTVEDVHVRCASMHYRDPERPGTPQCFNAAHLTFPNGDWGLASDLNHPDPAVEYRFYLDLAAL